MTSSDVSAKSVAKQKTFFGAVILNFGRRTAVVGGRLYRVCRRAEKQQGCCNGCSCGRSTINWRVILSPAHPPPYPNAPWFNESCKSRGQSIRPGNSFRHGLPNHPIGDILSSEVTSNISGSEQTQDEQHDENHHKNVEQNARDICARG